MTDPDVDAPREDALPVTFLLPREKLDAVRGLRIDRDWREINWVDTGWIGQTYLRLRDSGRNVGLSATLPDHGIVVYHPRELDCQGELDAGAEDLITIAARADAGPQYAADFEIVQNHGSADDRRCLYVPYWPQPGLIPRKAERGTRVENVSYKGDTVNLHPDFRSSDWVGALRRNGMCWLDHSQGRPSGGSRPLSAPWHDYSSTDVILAVRPDLERRYKKKPASKLVNAWHGGTPALLGPEIAYRELKRSDLDYLEIRSPAEALDALLKLRDRPELYRAMVENGLRRAEEFTVESITRRWTEVLDEIIPRRTEELWFKAFRSMPRHSRRKGRKLLDTGGARIRRRLTSFLQGGG